jgi:hypothetical protein
LIHLCMNNHMCMNCFHKSRLTLRWMKWNEMNIEHWSFESIDRTLECCSNPSRKLKRIAVELFDDWSSLSIFSSRSNISNFQLKSSSIRFHSSNPILSSSSIHIHCRIWFVLIVSSDSMCHRLNSLILLWRPIAITFSWLVCFHISSITCTKPQYSCLFRLSYHRSYQPFPTSPYLCSRMITAWVLRFHCQLWSKQDRWI